MKIFFKFIENILLGIYAALMFFVLLLLILIPIVALSDGFKIIETGYTVHGEYITIMIAFLILIYFSLRFRVLRKIYNIFPFLFETIKFLTIVNLFIAIGIEILNWSYITLSKGRHIFGIIIFIFSLVLWRVVVSVYYYKKPLINFIPKDEEKMKNYSEKVN